MRFFISYGHDQSNEETLALFLCRELQGANHKVFLDVKMAVGTNWVKEIGDQIRKCDCFVVLISECTLTSEMVQTEARIAYYQNKQRGTPAILPIRVCYRGPLDYELASFLDRLQCTSWETSADSPRILGEILSAAESRAAANCEPSQESACPSLQSFPPTDMRRPRPTVDPRIFSAPGGSLRIDDPFYIERNSDLIVSRRGVLPGETVVIKAPRQMGKSSLLLRYLAACRAKGKQIAFLDFSAFTEVDLEDYTNVLSDIAALLLRAFKVAAPPPRIERQGELTAFIEDRILATVPGIFTIAFDEVDRVMGTSYQRDFFTLLRQWHNNRPISAWERVDLALVISTEPYLLIDAADRSPFNVTPPLELAPFTAEQCTKLNERYDSPLYPSEVARVHEVFNGHPFLTRLAFYCLVTSESIDLSDLLERAFEGGEPFGDHLRALLLKLEQKQELVAALRQVIDRGSNLSRDAYYRLYGAGLVREVNGRVEPANSIYARFFERML